jgi:uncharacterized membrane protein YhaH (DUF805 family)
MNPILIALGALRRYRDFRGRSTRTELIMFWILTTLVGMVVIVVSGLAGLPGFVAEDPVQLALLCPSIALMVRRLHDTGRSGWWLLFLVPGAAMGLRREYLLWQNPHSFADAFLPRYVEVPMILLSLPILFLLFRDDEEGPNAYGPNPRYPDELEARDLPGAAA